jgi:hypothetical protein
LPAGRSSSAMARCGVARRLQPPSLAARDVPSKRP